ncbi:hypothetical protein FD755_015999, partial [Muntiacus reevesi]
SSPSLFAAANAIAEERRSQGSFSSVPFQPSNIKSPFKPVIDGSVLKNDIKQKLAKERREEKKRQDDANRETQLLEKERKSKIVYEKQMEEKQRKLREQKEKDEQRRISAEKKRNEMLEEERVCEHGSTPRGEHERTPCMSVETLLEANMKEHSEVNVEALLEESMKEHPAVNVEALVEMSMEAPPKVSVEALPEVNMEVPSVNVETSPETSENLSLEAHVDPSPDVSMDSSPDVSVNPSPEVSMDSSQEVSTEASSEASVDISPEASMETLPEESVETSPEESVEAFSEISMAALPEESVEVLSKDSTKGPSEASVEVPLETSPEVTVEISSKKSEMDEQPSNRITKKRIPPSQIPCYRWSSSPTRRWRPPSPISTSRQIQKNCPPSPSPGTSKQSTQFCFSYKVTPMQRTAFAQNALGTMGMKSKAGSNTVNNSETASQKDMICEESGNKGTPGPKNAEEATKILAEKRRLAREQKEKEERLQKEMEQRKMKDVAKKVDEGQEDKFSKFGDGQQPKEMKKRESQEQEDQKVELQKSDAKIKAQEEADKRKKERERIMLQNLQERLERKKRIEEIMKRTRKPDSNASKVVYVLDFSYHGIYQYFWMTNGVESLIGHLEIHFAYFNELKFSIVFSFMVSAFRVSHKYLFIPPPNILSFDGLHASQIFSGASWWLTGKESAYQCRRWSPSQRAGSKHIDLRSPASRSSQEHFSHGTTWLILFSWGGHEIVVRSRSAKNGA